MVEDGTAELSREEILQRFPHLLQYLNHHRKNRDTFNDEIPPFSMHEEEKRHESELSSLLQEAGMRYTQGSIIDIRSLPPDLTLLRDAADMMYNEYLTHMARAISKHAGRCEVDYWGIISGSPQVQNTYASDICKKLLTTYTWWNIYEHSSKGTVIEFRDTSGHGLRWYLDPLKFLGLVEPVDPHRGRLFYENIEDLRK
ncbi:MAG: hypothetical protein ACXAE3_08775 [Candidatus Kariarchaeaceae archaeon]|jgi:hypothetical protein